MVHILMELWARTCGAGERAGLRARRPDVTAPNIARGKLQANFLRTRTPTRCNIVEFPSHSQGH